MERVVPDFEQVYRLHVANVLRWAMRLGGPGIDVEDVAQEVFLKVHQELINFRGEAQITTWLYQITRNVVGNKRRKDKWRRWLSGLSNEYTVKIPATALSPLETAEQKQACAHLYYLLDNMNEKYRTVFILFEMEELSGEEIAEIMGAKVSTVWVWLHRARAQFKNLVEKHTVKELL